MNEDSIREVFPELLGRAYSLGCYNYDPAKPDIAQPMMGVLNEVMYWLHKEHGIWLAVKPKLENGELKFCASILTTDNYGYGRTGLRIVYIWLEQRFDDWTEAHIEGLKECLKEAKRIKATNSEK